MTTRSASEMLAARTGVAGISALSEGAPLEAFELLTAGEDGWAHSAWLGPGELVLDGEDLLVATWPHSTTSDNLRRSGQGVLQFIADGDPRDIVRLRLRATSLGPLDVEGRELAAFRTVVEDVRVDTVTYATVSTGVRYALKDEPTVTARWRKQVDVLLAHAAQH